MYGLSVCQNQQSVINNQQLICRSGVTLIGVIAAIVVMGLLGAGVLILVSIGSMESVQTLNWGQAFFAAESGVSVARNYINTNSTWITNTPLTITGIMGRATFRAEVDFDGGINSVGRQGNASWTSIYAGKGKADHAMLVYGSGSAPVGSPRYRIWGGTNWSSPSNALSVGSARINWVVVKACPTRDEYIAVTIDANRLVKAQVYRNGIWANLQTIATVPNAGYRGVDVAYETLSGDAFVVAADGDADPTCYVWRTNVWTGPTTVNLSRAGIANWVKLASDPVSDEIVGMVRDNGRWFTAQVWNGSVWGNEKLPGTRGPNVAYESMTVAYETSGSQAIIVSADQTSPSFKWSSWNGTTWSAEGTATIGNDLYWGTLVSDPTSDNLLLTYLTTDNDVGKVFWNGSSWTAYTEMDALGNSDADRCVQGQFENISGHTGHAIIPYSDTVAGRSRHSANPSGATWDAEVSVSTITDSATVQTSRTGDGKILALFFDDVNSRYDFSWYDGTVWSAMQTLENEPSVTASPFKEPFMMAPQIWVTP